MTSKCICWGRAGSGHLGGWKSGASWKPIPEVVWLAETTAKSSSCQVTGSPSSSE